MNTELSTAELVTPEQLHARFRALSALLVAHEHLWRPRPFIAAELPWTRDAPALAAWLLALPGEAIDAIEAEPCAAAEAPEPWGALRALIGGQCALPAPPRAQAEPPLAVRFQIPGRKWAQLQRFIAGARVEAAPALLDWCAGKGHLGRTLAWALDAPVTHIERDAGLCAAGARLSARLGVRSTFISADVLEAETWRHIPAGATALGLHACGALTDALLAQIVARGLPAAAVAPCCYHMLGGADTFTPRSAAGRDAALELSPRDLRLAIYDERVARPAERRARRREHAFRLGADLLVREARGVDAYHTFGRLPTEVLQLDFAAFAAEAARRAGHPLPPRWDAASAEAAGWERARTTRALALVRGLFRRPLELWLVLDRALYLLEQGLRVEVSAFCEPDLTPRNLLLRASHP